MCNVNRDLLDLVNDTDSESSDSQDSDPLILCKDTVQQNLTRYYDELQHLGGCTEIHNTSTSREEHADLRARQSLVTLYKEKCVQARLAGSLH